MSNITEYNSNDSMLRVDPQRAQVLAENLGGILQRVKSAKPSSRHVRPLPNSHSRSRPTNTNNHPCTKVRLIAVSKLKPASDILALHRPSSSSTPPHSHFGENYAQELQEKAELLPKSIRWHFIGALQTNKCKHLAQSVSNLECVSSVDSEKKANELEKGRAKCLETWREAKEKGEGAKNGDAAEEEEPGPLNVHVQVNTSGEDSKSGVDPADAAALCKHIISECSNLNLRGLMTIGAIARSQEASSNDAINEDFVSLRETRDKVIKELGLEEKGLELSMGMSADFEAAIGQGADEVRVGSDIFGERPARKDFKVKEDTAEEKI